jgi:hypothetical protein
VDIDPLETVAYGTPFQMDMTEMKSDDELKNDNQ